MLVMFVGFIVVFVVIFYKINFNDGDLEDIFFVVMIDVGVVFEVV